jgi:putative oxidoreductase
MITTGTRSKPLHVALWTAQVILAGLFLMAGFMKTFTPIDELAAKMPYVAEIPLLIRFIGVMELLGGVGLLLPSLLRIQSHLTPWAAVGIATIMSLAVVFHAWRGEWSALPMNTLFGALAAFIAWGRFHKEPIANKATTSVKNLSSI